MRTGSVFFLLGILFLTSFSQLPPVFCVFSLPVWILLAYQISWLRWPVWFLCGFLWSLFRADAMVAQKFDRDLEGIPVVVEGRIASLPETRGRAIRFNFHVDRLIDKRGNKRAFTGKIRLSWYYHSYSPEPGDYWRLQVKLKRPYGFMNPGGFDYEGWLFQQGILATGYVIDKPVNQCLQDADGVKIDQLRFHLRNRILTLLEDRQVNGLIAALTVGDRSALSSEQWQVLTRTGTNHLLAISGLHVGFIAGLAFFITRWLWPLTGKLSLSLSMPRVAAAGAFTAAVLYAALAGFSIPTQRALIMIGFVLLLVCNYRRTGTSHVMAIAMLLILIIDPFSVLSVGFWLSFLAIIVIACGMTYRIDVSGFWWRWGRVQWLVAIGLSPALVFWFYQVPLLTMLANGVAVPWVSLITVPMVLSGTIFIPVSEVIARLLLNLGAVSLDLLWIFLMWLADLKFSILPVPAASIPVFIISLVGIILLLMPKGIPGRWLGGIWLLPVFLTGGDSTDSQRLTMTVLDVGQGLAVVIRTHKHTLLYDTGPRYGSQFSAGSSVVIPYMKYSGVETIDTLIQSHGDSDHIGGLEDILKQLPVSSILTSVPDKIAHAGVADCKKGQSWQWDGVRFTVLHPVKGDKLRGNNQSCVLHIKHKTGSILLTGDIEAEAEQRLLTRFRDELEADILIVPHHGSLTSSTPAFIQAVKPDYAVFSIGYRNRFGFPKKDIIKRYQKRGIKTLETARSGAIEIRMDESGMTIIKHRQRLSRFWHTVY